MSWVHCEGTWVRYPISSADIAGYDWQDMMINMSSVRLVLDFAFSCVIVDPVDDKEFLVLRVSLDDLCAALDGPCVVEHLGPLTIRNL